MNHAQLFTKTPIKIF